MNHNGICLNEQEIERIHRDFMAGLYNDHDLQRLFESILLQRQVLREIFNTFDSPPLRRYSYVDALPNSQLSYWKELVFMEDNR